MIRAGITLPGRFPRMDRDGAAHDGGDGDEDFVHRLAPGDGGEAFHRTEDGVAHEGGVLEGSSSRKRPRG